MIQLNLHVLYLQCVRFRSHRTVFSQLREDRTKIAAIGSGCTLATEPAAEISHFWNIPQVWHIRRQKLTESLNKLGYETSLVPRCRGGVV